VVQKYDQAAKDFHTIAERAGESFLPAEKSHDVGEATVNTLFKNDMLVIFDDPELQKLGTELTSLMRSTSKKHAKDDFADALRYCVVSIPWDWSALRGEQTEMEQLELEVKPYTAEERVAMEIAERRGEFTDGRQKKKDDWQELEDEFAEWNEAYGS
jgi:hypothetical protein